MKESGVKIKMLIKKKLIIVTLIILLVLPLISAGNYGAGKYGSGLYGVGEVTSAPPTPPGGGGGAACTYNWQCTNWFSPECPESEIQERICINKGTCTGIIGMPKQIQVCNYTGPTEPLFDIFLTIPRQYTKVCAGSKIKANINLENYGKIELLDAFMIYWIINENNTLIAELKDTRAVQDKINFNTEIKIPELTSKGTYRLYAQIDYAKNKTAVAGESFEIIEGESCKRYFIILKFVLDNKTYFIYGTGFFVILLFVLLLTRKKNTKKKKRKEKKKKRKGKNFFKPKEKRKEKTFGSYKRKVSRIIERNKK